MLFDTHAHVNFNAFKDDADEVIKGSLENDIWMINVGSQYSTSRRAVEYAEKYETGIWAAVGLHPIHIKDESFDYDKYSGLAKSGKVVAVGEMGLDYHHFEVGDDVKGLKNKQKEIFEKAIDLANQVNKPLIIHCWDAYDDLLEILSKNPLSISPLKRGRGGVPGVIHSFIGGCKTARKFIDLGFKIGLNGIITYSESYDKLIRELSLEDIVLETDCPYLTPQPLSREERNEPKNTKYVAEKIAEVKGINAAEVEKITTQTASKLFGI